MSEFVLSLLSPPRHASDYGIAATLSRVADVDGRPSPASVRRLSIPGSGAVTVEAEPGAYRLEAYLPDGHVQDMECEVPHQASKVHVRVGGSRSGNDAHPVTAVGVASAGGMCAPGESVGAGSVAQVELATVDDTGGDWSAVLSPNAGSRKGSGGALGTMDISVTDDAFRIRNKASVGTRRWSRISLAGRTLLASLPFEPSGKRERTVEISHSRVGDPLVTLVDPRMGTMLAYLAAGHSQAASNVLGRMEVDIEASRRGRSFADAAEALLGGPLATCAAAYVATASGPDGRWMEVVDRLASIPWLPDGALLAGHALLRRGSDEAAWRRAIGWSRTAVGRGVPYFSMGVSLLADDLSILVGLDHTLERELSSVRSIARRTCPGEAFTVIAT